MDKWKLYSGFQITDEIFDKMLDLDEKLFTEEDATALGKDYIKSLYKNDKDGVFIIINERLNEIVGYMFNITISDEQLQQYLKDHDYSKLRNQGMREGKNNLYIYTLGTNPKYRGSIAPKILGKMFAEYIEKCKSENKQIGYCFAEAVSLDGVRTLSESMGMERIAGQQYGSDGTGFYHYSSKESFETYINKMIQVIDTQELINKREIRKKNEIEMMKRDEDSER